MNSLELAPRNIYVLNLPNSCNRENLVQFYSKFGSINHVCILNTCDSRGRRRAFINFDHHSAALRAVRETDGITLGPQQYRISTSFSNNQKNIPTQSASSSTDVVWPHHTRGSSGGYSEGVGGVYGLNSGGTTENEHVQFREQWEPPKVIRTGPDLVRRWSLQLPTIFPTLSKARQKQYSTHPSSSNSSDEVNYDDFDYVYSNGRQLFVHRSPVRNHRPASEGSRVDISRQSFTGVDSLNPAASPFEYTSTSSSAYF